MAPTTRGHRKKEIKSAEFIEEEDDFLVDDETSDAGSAEYDDDKSEMEVDSEQEEEEAEESEFEEPPKTPSRKCKTTGNAATTPSPPRHGVKRPHAGKAESGSDDPFVPSNTQDSPTKKARIAPSSKKKLPRTPAALKTPKSSTKSGKQSKQPSLKPSEEEVDTDEEDKEVSPSPLSTKTKAHQKIFDAAVLKAKKEKTKKVEDVQNEEDIEVEEKKDTVFLEDLTKDPVAMYPKLKRCGVNDITIMDKLLKGTYGPPLAKLPSGKKLVSWKKVNKGNDRQDNESQGPGMAKLTLIMKEYPKLDLGYIKQLITFGHDEKHNVVNLSRVDPALIISKQVGKSDMVCMRNKKKPALCVSMVVIEDDHTATTKTIGDDTIIKFITGTPLTQEFERFAAVLCMTHGVESARCQLLDNLLTFSTRSEKISGSPKKSSTPRKNLFAAFQSKATTSDKTLGYSYAVSSLSPNDTVPIVDAQGKKIKLPGGLTTIEKDFPAFEGVIPASSVALVGYTVGKYTAKAFPNDASLSLNLLWVAVLATGDDL